jgi:hypothetical protein
VPWRGAAAAWLCGLFLLLTAVGCGQRPTVAADAGPGAAPAGDAFYVPPNPLPAGRPGDLLWFRPVAVPSQFAGLGVELDEVLYLSTDALGHPDAVSGIVMLPPRARRASAPIVGFATGTHGMADSCAPSKEIAAGADVWIDHFQAAARQGWAVAASDYQGLGTPGDHTYGVGRSEGHAVIDAVRAAERLPGTGLSARPEVAFWGYSQGGGAAAWAGELAPSYAPDLDTVAVAAGGVPADLARVSAAVDGHAWAGVIFMAAVGFNAAYPELRLDDHLTVAARPLIARLKTLCLDDAIREFAGMHISDVLTTNLLADPVWKARLAENVLGHTPPRVPVLLYHGEVDTVVDFAQAQDLARAYCAAGVDVTWRPYAGEDHDAAWNHVSAVIAYLADRFRSPSTPVPRSCP